MAGKSGSMVDGERKVFMDTGRGIQITGKAGLPDEFCRFAFDGWSRSAHVAEINESWHSFTDIPDRIDPKLPSSHSGLYLRIFSHDNSGFPSVQIAAAIDYFRSIGGDFYTIYNLPGRRVGVVIADVCGKGKKAAGYVSVIQAALSQELNSGLYAGQILSNLNNRLARVMPDDRFATLFLGIYDTNAHSLEFANAGHPAGVLMHANGDNSQLSSTGPGLGMMADMPFGTCRISVSPEELLVLYTDGYEVDQPDGSTGGERNRFLKLIEKNRYRPPRDIVKILQDDMQEHMKTRSRGDDRTMMILQFSGAVSAV
jgi:sigma-B regulation protein RsbU (phosphoserine phosphatase)